MKDKSSVTEFLIGGLLRQYPYWPSTFGPCNTDGCSESARGSGYCANCFEKKLAEFIGNKELASELHRAIRQVSLLKHFVMEETQSSSRRSEEAHRK